MPKLLSKLCFVLLILEPLGAAANSGNPYFFTMILGLTLSAAINAFLTFNMVKFIVWLIPIKGGYTEDEKKDKTPSYFAVVIPLFIVVFLLNYGAFVYIIRLL